MSNPALPSLVVLSVFPKEVGWILMVEKVAKGSQPDAKVWPVWHLKASARHCFVSFQKICELVLLIKARYMLAKKIESSPLIFELTSRPRD